MTTPLEGHLAVVTSVHSGSRREKGLGLVTYDHVWMVCRGQLHTLTTPVGMCCEGQKLLVLLPSELLGEVSLIMLGDRPPYSPYRPRSR